MWYEGNPCNMHLLDLAAEVKRGVVEAGMVGYRFNTIGVSDGMSMGTEGMSYSLQSRDLIADSIETVMGGQVRCLSHSCSPLLAFVCVSPTAGLETFPCSCPLLLSASAHSVVCAFTHMRTHTHTHTYAHTPTVSQRSPLLLLTTACCPLKVFSSDKVWGAVVRCQRVPARLR